MYTITIYNQTFGGPDDEYSYQIESLSEAPKVLAEHAISLADYGYEAEDIEDLSFSIFKTESADYNEQDIFSKADVIFKDILKEQQKKRDLYILNQKKRTLAKLKKELEGS